jgi:hypothetical protein
MSKIVQKTGFYRINADPGYDQEIRLLIPDLQFLAPKSVYLRSTPNSAEVI